MKVLFINGSPHKNGTTRRAFAEMEKIFAAEGIESEIITLGTGPYYSCAACNSCKKTGKCIIDDVVNEIAAKARECDGIIFGSPTHYAGPSGALTSVMNRLFFSAGRTLAGKPGAAVAVARRGGNTSTLDQINKFMTICGMPIAPSQYWPMCYGHNGAEAEQDGEGMQIMRHLARNMVWLMKAIEAGKQVGINPPEREEWNITNFIR